MEHHSREDHANSHVDPGQAAMDHGGMHPAETEGASHEHHNGQAMQAEHASPAGAASFGLFTGILFGGGGF
jgi:hypothetical protein